MPEMIPVTPDNFLQAESDMYFGAMVKDGSFGQFQHARELADVNHQTIVAANRDTLYSMAVFDLDAGPVTITLPDSGARFMSMEVLDEEQYVPEVVYGGTCVLKRDEIGTRYVAVGVRTFIDPNDPNDLKAAHALQDAILVKQAAPGRFETPSWDPKSQAQVRSALIALGKTMPDTRHASGPRGKVDPVRHLIEAAVGWGGNPEKDALYLHISPDRNDGKAIYQLTVPADVPVDGFWSVTVYNNEGYLVPNPQNAYSFNNLTAKKDPGGSVTIQFGGTGAANCLPIVPGWKYTVRLYRPRPEVLDGRWTFPEALLLQ